MSSLTANVAEKAARAACSVAAESIESAEEAYQFTVAVAVEGNRRDILEQLDQEFNALLRVAKKGRWGDATPVPPEVFALTDVLATVVRVSNFVEASIIY